MRADTISEIGTDVRILYIEDNVISQEYVKRGIEVHGIDVDVCSDGVQGLERAQAPKYSMIVLDLGLPSMDGIEVLKRLRQASVETPILVLSARGHASARIEGLKHGADDYLAKPFALAELVARIRAVRRRASAERLSSEMSVGDLVLDTRRRSVSRSGRPVILTPKEFALLEHLMQNEGRVLSRSMITERIWGPAFEISAHVIAVHINNLRNKVDEGFVQSLIHTITGVGYMLEDRGRA